MNNSIKYENGFTLVELAIVMIVIGLLISGTLKTLTLIEQARVKDTISTIKETEAAFLIFKDTYGESPGDAINAQTRIPGCSAASFCLNGDGNNFIGSDGTDHTAWTSNYIATDRSTNREENMQFWKHLALADIMNVVNPLANTALPEWGETHPTSPFGGGFEIMYDGWMASGSGTGRGSHIIRLSNVLNARAQPVLTPQIAFQIDRKIDDGDANKGSVIANYGRTRDNCKQGNRNSAVYRENRRSIECILFFKMHSMR